MRELERVTELECGLWALRSKLARKCLGVALGSTQITDRTRKSHRKPSFEQRMRLTREMPLDQRERFARLTSVGEHHRFPGALARLGRASG
jgi:hypothetical protein